MNKRDTNDLIRILGNNGTAATMEALAGAARWHQRVCEGRSPVDAVEWDRSAVNLEAYSANVGKWLEPTFSTIERAALDLAYARTQNGWTWPKNDLEVDAHEATSVGEDGVWVRAWVHVSKMDIAEEMESQ